MSRLFKRLLKRPQRDPQLAPGNQNSLPAVLTNDETSTPILDARSANLGLKVIYEPSIPSDAIADVIFVHGLTGSSYHTWRHEESGTHWPSELLCKEVPNVRVASFGYDADVIGFMNPVSSNRISNHAGNLLGALARLRDRTDSENRSIIFVAHSLGGLVVEEALRVSRAHAERFIRQIETQTSGLVFLGTPHHGADKAAWAAFSQKILQIAKTSNKDIVAVLRSGSEMLAVVQDGFHSILRLRREEGSEIAITCFYEELPLLVVGEVVPKESAIIAGYSHYGIHANHMDMTKFAHVDDEGFLAVSGEIRRWVKRTTPAVLSVGFSEEQQEFLRSLDFEDSRHRQDDVEPAHYTTYEWVWTRPEINFSQFLQSDDSLFWISGKPGSGKSTMMKYLAETLPNHLTSQDRGSVPLIANYFIGFDRSDVAKSMVGILRSLLRQILKASPDMISAVMHLFLQKKATESNFAWTKHDLQQCLQIIFKHAVNSKIVLLIDALDEYGGEDDQISTYFLEMAAQHHKVVKICVSSRERPAFVHDFSAYPGLRMEVETKEDIRTYVNSRFSDGRVHRPDMLVSTMASLQTDIVNKADGVFLWVRLVCDDLIKAKRRGEDTSRLKTRLLSMPDNLNALYQRILDDIALSDRNEAMAMLAIVNTSFEPLSPLELRYALHYSLDIYDDVDDEQLAEDRITAITAGFLDVRATGDDRATVYLAHHTVKTYLNSISAASHVSSSVDMDMLSSDGCILRACARRLALLSNYDIGPPRKAFRLVKEDFSFVDEDGVTFDIAHIRDIDIVRYSISYFVQHAEKYEELKQDASPILLGLSIPFQHWSLLLEGVDLPVSSETSFRTLQAIQRDVVPKTMIEFTILADLEFHFCKLLTSEVDVNQNNGRLLYAVAYSGNTQMAVKLLDRGAVASPNMPYAPAAFVRAIYHGNLQVARLFLMHGANPNIPGLCTEKQEMSALEAAVKTSNYDAITLLAEFHTQLDCYIPVFGNALQAAARRGDVGLLQMLLDLGADVNCTMRDSIYLSPLEAAMLTTNRDDQKHILELLLAAGASLSVARDDLEPVLLIDKAVELGEAVAVQIFLQYGAAIPKCLLCKALCAQADSGAPNTGRIVRLLIEHGATVDQACTEHLGLETPPDLTLWSDEYSAPILDMIQRRPWRGQLLLDTLETTSTREGEGEGRQTPGPSSRALSPWIPSNLLEHEHESGTATQRGDRQDMNGLLAPVPRQPKQESAHDPVLRVSSPGGVPPSRPRSVQY